MASSFQVQEQEQEQEKEKEVEEEQLVEVEYATVPAISQFWQPSSLARLSQMCPNTFFPLRAFLPSKSGTRLPFPVHLLVSENLAPLLARFDAHRRLRNVNVVLHWSPKCIDQV